MKMSISKLEAFEERLKNAKKELDLCGPEDRVVLEEKVRRLEVVVQKLRIPAVSACFHSQSREVVDNADEDIILHFKVNGHSDGGQYEVQVLHGFVIATQSQIEEERSKNSNVKRNKNKAKKPKNNKKKGKNKNKKKTNGDEGDTEDDYKTVPSSFSCSNSVISVKSSEMMCGLCYTFRVSQTLAMGMGGTDKKRIIMNATEVKILGKPPDTPEGLSSGGKEKRNLKLWWTKPLSNGSSISGYTVSIASNDEPDKWQDFSCEKASLVVPSVEPGSRWLVRVRAESDLGPSAWSPHRLFQSMCTIPDPCGKPSTVGKRLHSALHVSWDTPSFRGGGNSSLEYILEVFDGSRWDIVYRGTTADFLHENLFPNTTYAYRVFAVNHIGKSSVSETANLTTSARVPDAPSAVRCTSIEKNSLAIAWAASKFDGGLPVKVYEVEIRRRKEKWERLYSGSSTHMKAEGMSPGERVQLRVFAKNDVGRSRASAIENHAVPCALPGMPPAPTFECCDASSAKIHLCPPSNIGGGTLKGYRVELAIRSKVEKQRATSSIRLEMPEHCDYFKSNFQVGDLCDAKWKDGMYYPARIMDMLDDEPKLLEIQFGELDAADLRMSVPIESVRTRLQISEECLITYEGRPTRGVVIGTVDDKESGGYAVEILLHDELLQLEMSPQYIQRLWDHGEILRYGVRRNTEAKFLREVETKKTTTEPFTIQHEEKIRAHSESDAKILHTLPSLDPANVYATRVYFKNSAGWSEASPELQFSIGAASLPDAPLIPEPHSVSSESITLRISCVAKTSRRLSVQVQKVQEKGQNARKRDWKSAAEIDLKGVDSEELTLVKLSDLAPATMYAVRARTENAVGWSNFSKQQWITTDQAAPSPPANFRVKTLGVFGTRTMKGDLCLLWDPPENRHGSHVDSYSVEFRANRQGDFQGLQKAASSLHAVRVPPSIFMPGSLFEFRVRAHSSAGMSKYASLELETMAQKPPAPIPPFLAQKPTEKTVSLSWNPSTFPCSDAVLSWTVRLKSVANEDIVLEKSHSAHPSKKKKKKKKKATKNVNNKPLVTFKNLDQGTSWKASLRATTSAGDGAWSDEIIVATVEARTLPQVPGAPFLVDRGEEYLTLAWEPNDDAHQTDNSRIYILEMATGGKGNGKFTCVFQGTETEVTVKNLRAGMMYHFRVQACEANKREDLTLRSKFSSIARESTSSAMAMPKDDKTAVGARQPQQVVLQHSKHEKNEDTLKTKKDKLDLERRHRRRLRRQMITAGKQITAVGAVSALVWYSYETIVEAWHYFAVVAVLAVFALMMMQILKSTAVSESERKKSC